MVHVYMESISVTYFEEIDITTFIISVLQELILFSVSNKSWSVF